MTKIFPFDKLPDKVSDEKIEIAVPGSDYCIAQVCTLLSVSLDCIRRGADEL